jgi:hypothetical protein
MTAWPAFDNVEAPQRKENWLLFDLDKAEPLYWGGRVRGWFYPGEYLPGVRNVYLKSCGPEHFCVKHQGWGISVDIVGRLGVLGCEWVCIKYAGASGAVEKWATFERFTEGIYDTLNEDDGPQTFVPDFLFTDRPQRQATFD